MAVGAFPTAILGPLNCEKLTTNAPELTTK